MSKHPVFIGIDFGTCATKVAYNILGGGQITPLTFHSGLWDGYYPPYCLPSLAAFDDKKRLLFGLPAARSTSGTPEQNFIPRMKMVLAGQYDERFCDEETRETYSQVFEKVWGKGQSLEPEILIALYLCEVMLLSARKIQGQHSSLVLEPYFFVCMPIHHLHHEEVRSAFETVLALAQKLYRTYVGIQSENRQRLSQNLIGYCRQWLKDLTYNEAAESTRVFFGAETLAQVASYRFSPARENGIHVLIDIGAGTTDITVLNLVNVMTDQEKLDCFAWSNLPQGGYLFEKAVRSALSDTNSGISPQEVLSSFSRAGHEASIRNAIYTIAESIWQESKEVWGEGYQFGIEHGRRDAKSWIRDNLTVLISGGGAQIPGIKTVFEESPISPQKSSPWGPHPVLSLPEPEAEFGGQEDIPFRRMAVAYGLANERDVEFRYRPDTGPAPRPRVIDYSDYDGSKLVPNRGWLG